MSPSKLRPIPLVVLTAIAFLALGLFLGGHPDSLPSALRSVFVSDNGIAARDELIKDVHDGYYKPVSTNALQQASLKGIVQSLDDPYSEYFTPAETKVFEQGVNDQFDGVGIEVQPLRDGLLVQKVIPASPAQRRGVKSGEEIVAVNGHSIAGVPSEVSTAQIKGPAGTSVTLGLRPPGAGRRSA